MNLAKTAVLAVLIPACLLASPGSALRIRLAGRGRREEFELLSSAYAGDLNGPRSNDHFVVTLRILPREEVIAECKRLGAWGEARPGRRSPVGCNIAYLDRTPLECVIIAEAPQDVDDDRTTILGHELWHCARGIYH